MYKTKKYKPIKNNKNVLKNIVLKTLILREN